MGTRGISDPSLYDRGSDSEQRGGRIPIHSLLTPSYEPRPGASSAQRGPPGPHASPSESPAARSFNYAATTASPKVDLIPARRQSSSFSLGKPRASSPLAYNDLRMTHQPPPTSSLVAADVNSRTPRAPRPSYSEEQKFFIMYARIMRDMTWPEIEDQFSDIFGTRTKGGLTSVYYRVRSAWGLMDVLKSGPDSFTADCTEVELRARNFSAEFLAQIGYLAD